MVPVSEFTESQFWPLEFDELAVAFIFSWMASISVWTLARSTPGCRAVCSLARMFCRSPMMLLRPL
ncbi:hypothetical protein ASF39_02900 [Methylobacterium sp. Leaf108]|nr:hypothetical protein ASF39_02900 [Methylobacterium sp. Leaf108]